VSARLRQEGGSGRRGQWADAMGRAGADFFFRDPTRRSAAEIGPPGLCRV
jgi:hypothetical protein